jgi:predicted Zn-ribbon and HTH transcriptional regulator
MKYTINGCHAKAYPDKQGKIIVECNPPNCKKCGWSQKQPTLYDQKLTKNTIITNLHTTILVK